MTPEERHALFKASIVFSLAAEEILRDTYEVTDDIKSLNGLDREERLIFNELFKAHKCYERAIRMQNAYYMRQHSDGIAEKKRENTGEDLVKTSKIWLKKWDELRDYAKSMIREFFYREDVCGDEDVKLHQKWEAGHRKMRDRLKEHRIHDAFLEKYGKLIIKGYDMA